MNYKGYCLWADDVPDEKAPHYIVISSDEDEDGNVLVLAISSIKYNIDGTPKYYDKACPINIGDIIDCNGKNIITKPSFIRYQYAVELPSALILEKQLNNKYKYKSKISEELLKRIQDGSKISLELEPRLKKYFKYF